MGRKWMIGYLRVIWYKQKPEFLLATNQVSAFVQGFQVYFGFDNLVIVDLLRQLYYTNEYQDIFKSKFDSSREHLSMFFL